MTSRAIVLALVLVAAHAVAVAADIEERYCVTVRSDKPIEGGILAAVIAGEATITVEAADACASPPAPGATPGGVVVSATRVTGTAAGLLASLEARPEDPTGYDRDLFEHWVDADADGCDARDEVLIEESVTPVSVGGDCELEGGTWVSAYDGLLTREPSRFDIDHVVPLAEAWRSSAKGWTAERREAFANDLGDERSLRAVSATSNRAKGDQDPAEWLPPVEAYHCEYVSGWVAVKVRWALAVDPAEHEAIADVLADRPPQVVTVEIR